MKQLYIFILAFSFSYLGFAQEDYVFVQLELVNPNMGYPIYEGNVSTNTSNDDGLNQILAANTIFSYRVIYPEAYLGENVRDVFHIMTCLSADANQLVLDLNAYDPVVRYAAEETVDGMSTHILNLVLEDEATGVLTGTNSDNLITTNDATLTQIFQDFSVRTYVLNPGDSANTSYSLICDCDAQLLKTELNNYTAVIENVSDVFNGQLLSVGDEIKITVNIHPNPFKNKVSIDTNQKVKSILLFDVLGKQVFKSTSILDFKNFSASLRAGVYLLKLVGENGEAITKKIVKS
jgi:hypothetical protein